MGLGAVLEPAVVLFLLFGGTWLNRNSSVTMAQRDRRHYGSDDEVSTPSPSRLTPFSSDDEGSSFLHAQHYPGQESPWRKRQLSLLGLGWRVTTPNTRVFKDRFLSRVLRKFPFLVEAWYWALIYWVYQLGRAFTALTLVESTVDVARHHALQVIHLEQSLHIFFEPALQRAFMSHIFIMHWTNRIYSFIHIPGTIAFLVWLYYFTTTRNRIVDRKRKDIRPEGTPAGPALYEARRRTMAMCNLIAFVVFTLWPCMPPRLLSDETVISDVGREARSYGFVDTVHGSEGESSVWTQNKFCNQYAAMPSLHFGYSLLIGLTILSIPLPPSQKRSSGISCGPIRVRIPTFRRLLLVAIGVAYPTIILLAIITTANHFVLDAVAGAIVCGVAWKSNGLLLNLLAVEDYFLWLVRIHKPETRVLDWREGEKEDDVHDESWGVKGVTDA